jgi:uncharacterized membrane protein
MEDFNQEENKSGLAFTTLNYIIMLVGILVLAIGFMIMASGTEQEMFGTSQITVGPMMLMLGFIIEFVAILYKPKPKQD